MLVFFGVIGELFCDWPEMTGRRALAKKGSAILLVVGLGLEFVEAAKSDIEVARMGLQMADTTKKAEEAIADANEYRIRLLQLEQKIHIRDLTPELKAKISATLKDAPRGKIVIAYEDDYNSFVVAGELHDFLTAIGFSVDGPELDKMIGLCRTYGNGISEPINGITVCFADKSNVPAYTPAMIDAMNIINGRIVTGMTWKPFALSPVISNDELLIDVAPDR